MIKWFSIAVILVLVCSTVACHKKGIPLSSKDTLLEVGIREEARGGQEGSGYDSWEIFSAAEILPPELLTSDHYRVSDQVVLFGPQFSFELKTDYGTFHARGEAMLRRRVAEIHAIAELVQLAGTKGYAQGVKQSLLSPFEAMKALVIHPVDTITGIPTGAYSLALQGV
jgi:hypothetical protein